MKLHLKIFAFCCFFFNITIFCSQSESSSLEEWNATIIEWEKTHAMSIARNKTEKNKSYLCLTKDLQRYHQKPVSMQETTIFAVQADEKSNDDTQAISRQEQLRSAMKHNASKKMTTKDPKSVTFTTQDNFNSI